MLRKRKKYGEHDEEFHAKGYFDLARYNDEVAHGIMHTEHYKARMAAIQHRFDQEQRQCAKERGMITIEASPKS